MFLLSANVTLTLQSLYAAIKAFNDPPVTKESLNEFWLGIPFAVFLIASLATFAYRTKLSEAMIKCFLEEKKQRRRHFILICIGLVLPMFLTFSYDFLDLSEVAKLNIRTTDIVCASISSLCLVAMVFGQYVVLIYEDSWETIVDNARMEKEYAKASHESALRIATAFRKVVEIKAERVRELRDSEDPISIEDLKEALNPESQICALAQVVFELYSFEFRRSQGEGNKLRVAYYSEENGCLSCKYCVDEIGNACVSATSGNNSHYFLLDSSPIASLAVYAARERSIEIVENAQKADADSKSYFQYFDQSQRDRIRSIMAIPLIYNSEAGPAKHVICIDCDKEAYFQENDRPIAELFADNILGRMMYELDMQAILGRVT